jgi:hypothetical protein
MPKAKVATAISVRRGSKSNHILHIVHSPSLFRPSEPRSPHPDQQVRDRGDSDETQSSLHEEGMEFFRFRCGQS